MIIVWLCSSIALQRFILHFSALFGGLAHNFTIWLTLTTLTDVKKEKKENFFFEKRCAFPAQLKDRQLDTVGN